MAHLETALILIALALATCCLLIFAVCVALIVTA